MSGARPPEGLPEPFGATLLADARGLAGQVLAAAGGRALQAYEGPEEG